MNPISGITPQRVTAPEAARPASPAEAAAQEERAAMRKDEYIPGEEEEPIGLYRLERDEEGRPRVSFDDPSPRAEEAESCTVDTTRVDREIEALREQERQLKQSLQTEDDEKKRGDLERQLARIQSELMQKDNDTYRRSHAVVS